MTETARQDVLDFRLIGHNVRCSRMVRNKTQAEVAKAAGVDRATVRRLESGVRIQYRNLEKVCAAMDRPVGLVNSIMVYGNPDEVRSAHVCRSSELTWYVRHDQRKRVPKDHQRLIQLESERLRLARLGFVAMFEAHMITMPYGPSVSISEICGPVEIGPHPTFNECIVYCLQGQVRIKTEHELISIGVGEAVGLNTAGPSSVEPDQEIGIDGTPPVILFLMANRKGHVPIAVNDVRRKRIRHPRSHG